MVAVVLVLMLLSACGGETASDVYGEIDSAGGEAGDDSGLSTDGGVDVEAVEYAELDVADGGGQLAEDARLALIDFYEEFRWSADFESTGEDSFIEDYATAEVIAQFEVEAAENQEKLDDDLGIGDIARYSVTEVMSVAGTVQDAVLTSCNEVLADRPNGMQTTRYQTEEVRIVSVDGDWMITERALLHDGSRDEPTLGCVPTAFVARSEQTMEGFLADYTASYANPSEPVPGILERLDEDLADDMGEELESFVAQGVAVTDTLEYSMVVKGADNFRSGRTFVVEVCTHYPDGIGLTDAATGERVGEVAFVGETLSSDYRLWFSSPDGGDEMTWKIFDRSEPRLVDGCEEGD